MKHSNKASLWTVVGGLMLAMTAGAAGLRAQGQSSADDTWLHVRVESHEGKGENVRVNMPLSLAEAILPSIHNDKLDNGRIRIGNLNVNGVDVRAILAAVRDSKDGEFVTVQTEDSDVKVTKKDGILIVHVVDHEKTKASPTQVEVRVPMPVVEALLSSKGDELDVLAAVKALAHQSASELVSVEDGGEHVRIWVDTSSTSD
jgi:hypothetical protein